MIVTYNWLKEFVDFKFTVEELSHRLTMAGLEVDFLEKIGEGLDSVVVGQLQAVDAHPEADRLTLCKVDVGSEVLQIVCGARNHRVGDYVAVAQIGSVLPGDFKIKKSKIRGVESQGMLCSEKELGLAVESEGILILPSGLQLGTSVFSALGLKDARFELGLTPNRPDCLSVVGVAREVAAMAGQSLRLPQPHLVESTIPSATVTSVTIEDADLCPRYAARLIRGVKIGPSPQWLVRRLESVGQRSINNVVDVTNYVLMELGHPLHAFDFNLLRGGRIVVRPAAEGELFTTLDSQVRQLKSSDLMICDAVGPVALAGIMGGENSEIQPQTTDILLESAYFNPAAIRRTSKRLGMHTEASHRFERGADIDMVPLALDRAAALIVEVAGGAVLAGMIDAYPQQIAERRLTISDRRTRQILGIDLGLERIAQILASIGLTVLPPSIEMDHNGILQVLIPTFRPDLEREIDLIEEVARINGYDAIPETMPVSRIVNQRPSKRHVLAEKVRNLMVASGHAETINYAFINPDVWDKLGLSADDSRRNTIKVSNPLTEDQSVMRTSLLPSLLETAVRNLSYRSRDLRLFELRPVFLPRVGEELPEEPLRLGILLCGRREPDGWAQEAAAVDFFDLKGIIEEIAEVLRVPQLRWQMDAGESFLHPGKSAVVYSHNLRLGVIGELHPQTLAAYEIDTPVYIAEFDLESFFEVAGHFSGIKPLSRFPDLTRDSALLVGEEVSAVRLFELFDKVKSKDAEELILFDLYRGKGIDPGQKSMAIRVRYRSPERTLTDEEVNRAHGKLVETLCKELNAKIR